MPLTFGAINNSWQVLGSADGGGASGGSPSVLLASATAAGAATTFVRTDDTIKAFDRNVPPAISLTAGAAGTATFAAASDHTHLSAIQSAVKTADQAFTVTALANVTDLSFTIAANATGTYSFFVPNWALSATTGLALGLNGPGGSSRVVYTVEMATTTTTSFMNGATAYGTRLVNTAAPITMAPAYLFATVVNGATSGTVALQAGSEVNACSITIGRGAYGWAI